MELYRENKVNPAGGCLPILIQLPILFALFGVLRSGIIPKDSTFLWMKLADPDPFLYTTYIKWSYIICTTKINGNF